MPFGSHNFHSLFHLPRDYTLAKQTLSVDSVDEKLEVICVPSRICYREVVRICILQAKALTIRLLLATGAVVAHKCQKASVKARTL